jgi:FdhE protein
VTVPHRSKSASAGFEAGLARAEALALTSSSARELFGFAAGLLRAQAGVATALSALHSTRSLAGRPGQDLRPALAELLAVPRFAALHGPEPLAEAARKRLSEDEPTVRARLEAFWSGARYPDHDYLSRAMLRPYAEVLRAHEIVPDHAHARGRCPFCGGAPWIACRRGGGESAGAARSLVCALCGLEWPFQRIMCPACFEADPDKLPAFTSEAIPTARLEACETCRRYIKSIDLSQDARAVPEVDDLASLALDLWAGEERFTRMEPGLAGV